MRDYIDYDMRMKLKAAKNKEVKWAIIRHARTVLLRESDWTQMPDVDMTEEKKKAWRDYRKKLRDITVDFKSPDKVELPYEPT